MSSSIPYISRSTGSIGEKSDARSLDNLTNKFAVKRPDNIFPDRRKPEINGGNITTNKGKYSTDRELTANLELNEIIKKMNKSVYIPTTEDNVQKSFIKTTQYYNRFKIANPNLPLQKGFAHVFFVRPNCNILNSTGKKLITELESHEIFNYAWHSTPDLLKELVITNGYNHDFMMSLSNFAASFSLNDEFIENSSYGTTFTGYKIAYGKNNISSKTAGSFVITYDDDRNFHIYQLHRLWVEYINGVYRGTIIPTSYNVFNKILDYVSAAYYIVTAEDGETIIFWTKYYGVFPTTIPATQYSWAKGNVITNPQLDIEYQYSFKDDYNPFTIIEFNYNSRVDKNGIEYVPTFDKKLGQTGETWVGAPFIELKKGDGGIYEYKLRFREK